MTSEFVFKKDTHDYFLGDRKLLSVTQCFEEWIKLPNGDYYNTITDEVVNGQIMERAMKFGNALHLGFFYSFRHGLDWSTLHGRLIHPMKQIEKWKEDWGVEAVYLETPMLSRKHLVAGTSDLICTLSGDRKKLVIVDLKKKGAGLLVRVQLKAYEMIFREWLRDIIDFNKKSIVQKGYTGLIDHYSLKVGKDGDYQFKKEPCQKNDWNFFLSCLYRKQYLMQYA
jgi:hypothetical protein